MPRPDPRRPRSGQDALPLDDLHELLADPRAGEVLRGRHSQAMDAALDAARDAELIADVDGGAATILRAGAWALDSFEKQDRPYGPAKLVPALTEALRELHMTPESRQTDVDKSIVDLLADLATVEADAPQVVTEDDGGAALPHTQA